MKERDRRTTPKGQLEKESGKRIDVNFLPAIHKVQIMEFLLTCPYTEVAEYKDKEEPIFIAVCARLLEEKRLDEYMSILDKCRQMAREDALNS